MGLWTITALFLAGSLVWAAPPEGKGKDNAPGQEKKAEQGGGNSSNAGGNSAATRGGGNADNVRADRTHPHADKAADRAADGAANASADRAVGRPSVTGRDRQPEHAGKGGNRDHTLELAQALTKFDHARWNFNPHDTRGQGNMGKVLMRDPYGFDKDSGREGRDRGRPIREIEAPVLNLAEVISVDFSMTNVLDYYYKLLAYYQSLTWASRYVTYLQAWISYYESLSFETIRVNLNDSINYTMTLASPDGFTGTNLLITTELVSVNDYNTYGYTDTWQRVWIDYDAGEVVYSQTQEATLGEDGTLAFSYNPPSDLTGYTGNYFELRVTVTEPVSGATYTVTYDKQLYLYRCPYGVVYDKATKKPIAGAVVTVHDAATGAIIALDKGANPHQSNPQTTDATGRYDAKLQIGRQYYITVKAPGYEEYQSPVFSERWHVVREDIPLQHVQTMVKK